MTRVLLRMFPWIVAGLLCAIFCLRVLSIPEISAAELRRQYGEGSAFLTLNSGTIVRYRDYPAEAHVETLLLLHGGNMSLETWAPWIERLRGRVRIVVVDLPGHGLTGATAENNYSVAGMVAFVESFTEALGLDRIVLVGHSMGGHVAWRYAIEHPRRVAKLVLIAPAGFATPGGPQGRASRVATWPGSGTLLSLVSTRVAFAAGLRSVIFEQTLIEDEVIDRQWAMSRREGTPAATVARLRSGNVDPVMVTRLNEIAAPTLILWGRDDDVFPVALSTRIVAGIGGSKRILYERCNHFPMIERPDESVQDVVAFLEKLR